MIYFIQAGENGPIKIGLAQDVYKRIAEIQTGHYERLQLIGLMEGEREQERLTHNALADFRLNKEWFSPSPAVLEFISKSTFAPPERKRKSKTGILGMLEQRKGTKSLDNWVFEINQVVQPADEDRLKSATLYSYIRGSRDITGKGAKLLAQYFYRREDFSMVDAISQVALGIPYPVPANGKD